MTPNGVSFFETACEWPALGGAAGSRVTADWVIRPTARPRSHSEAGWVSGGGARRCGYRILYPAGDDACHIPSSPKFPVPSNQLPGPPKKFGAPLLRELGRKTQQLQSVAEPEIGQEQPIQRKFPDNSLHITESGQRGVRSRLSAQPVFNTLIHNDLLTIRETRYSTLYPTLRRPVPLVALA